jgi:hypothetical protein
MISVLLITLATAAAIAGFLAYKGTFNALNYSNWLFYAGMAYIAIGGLSAYGTFMSTNNYSYKYMSSVMTGDYETRKRIDDALINTGLNFMIRMIIIGILLFIISASADVI